MAGRRIPRSAASASTARVAGTVRSHGGPRTRRCRTIGRHRRRCRPGAAPLAATRRPSAGASDSAWGTAPLQRRPPPSGWGGGAYAPSYGGSAPRFGAWDAVLAWSLLNSLSRPQSVAYFQDNRSDPRYTQWRAEADRTAANDPAVAKKLAELDTLMAQSKAQPTSSPTTPPGSDGSGAILVVVFAGGAVLVGLWLLRRRAAAVAGAGPTGAAHGLSSGPTPPGLTGSAASRFRVGMTIPLDPAPFLLAAGRDEGEAARSRRDDQRRGVGAGYRRCGVAASALSAGTRRVFHAASRAGRNARRVPIFLVARSDCACQPGRVGVLAGSSPGVDRLAAVSDQGRQDLRPHLGARGAAACRRASKSRRCRI